MVGSHAQELSFQDKDLIRSFFCLNYLFSSPTFLNRKEKKKDSECLNRAITSGFSQLLGFFQTTMFLSVLHPLWNALPATLDQVSKHLLILYPLGQVSPQVRPGWLVADVLTALCICRTAGRWICKGHTLFPQTCPWILSTAPNTTMNNRGAEGKRQPVVLPPPAIRGSSLLLPSSRFLSSAIFVDHLLDSVFLRVLLHKFYFCYVRWDDLAPVFASSLAIGPLRKGAGVHTSHSKSSNKVFSRIKSYLSWCRFYYLLAGKKKMVKFLASILTFSFSYRCFRT